VAVLTHADLVSLWQAQSGINTPTDQQADTAAAIAQAESGGDTSRINNTAYPNRPGYHAPSAGSQKEFSVGLWQINMLAHPQYTEASLLTAGGNAQAAVAISNHSTSWSAWTTYKTGAYKQYLTSSGSAGPVRAPTFDRAWTALMHTLAFTLPAANLRQRNAMRRIRKAVG
jgi:Lysozyme like domain